VNIIRDLIDVSPTSMGSKGHHDLLMERPSTTAKHEKRWLKTGKAYDGPDQKQKPFIKAEGILF